jgi:hypothetical protein
MKYPGALAADKRGTDIVGANAAKAKLRIDAFRAAI